MRSLGLSKLLYPNRASHITSFVSRAYRSDCGTQSHINIDLDNATEPVLSAFKTLYMRYQDTLHSEPILNDKFSSQYLNSFIYSPSHLPPKYPAVSSVLEPYRAKIIDMNVIQWIQTRYANYILNIEKKTHETKQIINPNDVKRSKSVLHIIELGVGFDTRFERIFLRESNQNKRIEHQDYFMNEEEKVAMAHDDEQMFDTMLNNMPSIAEMDNTICCNDYDVIFYYEIDFNHIIEIRNKLIQHHNINESHNVYRKTYGYSVNDMNWFDAVKKDIILNHKQENGKQLNTSFRNVCIVCESLFLFLKKHEMKQLIQNCANMFNGAHLICDESFTNEGLMNIEKDIINENPLSYDINNKVFILKLKEVNQRLSCFVRWTVGFAAKNNYKILCIQFVQPIQSQLEQTQL